MVKPILSRIFQGLFFASFVWIYFSVMFTNSGDKPWISILVGIAMLAIGIGIAYFCKKVVIKWNPKVIHGIFAGIAVIILSLLIYFSFSLKAAYLWDAGDIYRAATAPLTGEQLPDNYFATYPNNIFSIFNFQSILQNYFCYNRKHRYYLYHVIKRSGNIYLYYIYVFNSSKIMGTTYGTADRNYLFVFCPILCICCLLLY